MCIGIPMRVIESWHDGALASGRGRCERVDTRLLGSTIAPGQWLLVAQGTARETLDAARAAEIDSALDLLEAALAGDAAGAACAPAFAMPSSLDAAQVARLTGQAGAPSLPPGEDP